MTEIYLIRHGQASFGKRNYDVLSAVGEQQATALGQHLQRIGWQADVILAGDMQRQQHTATLACAELNGDVPQLQINPAFNEYDAEGLFKAYYPQVIMADAEIRQDPRAAMQDKRLFQRAFGQIVKKWLTDEPHNGDDIERWDDFVNRVQNGLQALIDEHPANSRIAIFTSGGAISVCLKAALDLNAKHTLGLNWRVANSSVTQLTYGRSGLAMNSFNNITHLQLASVAQNNPALITYR